MSLINELLAGLEAIDPAKAEQLRAELDVRAPEPVKPPTILDQVREAYDLTVSEIPNINELPIVVGVAVQRLLQVETDLADLRAAQRAAVEQPAPSASPVPAAPAFDFENGE